MTGCFFDSRDRRLCAIAATVLSTGTLWRWRFGR